MGVVYLKQTSIKINNFDWDQDFVSFYFCPPFKMVSIAKNKNFLTVLF